MKKGLKIQVVLLALAILLLGPVCYAQNADNIDKQLNRDKKLRHSTIPRSGEFKLSLGSQLFTSVKPVVIPGTERNDIITDFADLSDNSLSRNSSFSTTNTDLRLKSSRTISQKRFVPVITLNNSYEDNAIDLNDSASSGLAIAGEKGRLQVYGEFEQKQRTQIPVSNPISVSKSVAGIRASVIEPSIPEKEQSDPHENNAALSSQYYLEAIYSFKPTLKGKVSFKRSMIDTFESEEKLQVEGIVEANRNVLIKAGYNNEVRPEVTEPKSSKDTKVWTEFILKF